MAEREIKTAHLTSKSKLVSLHVLFLYINTYTCKFLMDHCLMLIKRTYNWILTIINPYTTLITVCQITFRTFESLNVHQAFT